MVAAQADGARNIAPAGVYHFANMHELPKVDENLRDGVSPIPVRSAPSLPPPLATFQELHFFAVKEHHHHRRKTSFFIFRWRIKKC